MQIVLEADNRLIRLRKLADQIKASVEPSAFQDSDVLRRTIKGDGAGDIVTAKCVYSRYGMAEISLVAVRVEDIAFNLGGHEADGCMGRSIYDLRQLYYDVL